MKNFLKNFFDIKFWKFILVGIINTLVGNGLQFILYNFTPLNSLESTGVFIASAMGYIIGSIVSYFLNQYFTFKNSEKGWRPIVRFAVNIAVCWVIAYVIAIPLTAFICTSMSLGLFGMSVADTSANLSMLVGSVLFVICNYTGQRFFAFKEK
jgi:putative flippase GtrA